MTEQGDVSPDLEPADHVLAEQLDATRPAPGAGFRGALGRRLLALDPGYGPRPEHLRPTVAVFLATGALLLLLGGLVSAGLI
ncbi:MAG: hypothetical protein ACLP0J_25240 [Solirubrobacteraceae bacterium]|jgi:hypothetical protein